MSALAFEANFLCFVEFCDDLWCGIKKVATNYEKTFMEKFGFQKSKLSHDGLISQVRSLIHATE